MENEYGTATIQAELLTMMKTIHSFMVQNDISYSLCGGTLLGAIRHNGFIPWDDDFDLVMSRGEFNKFARKYEDTENKPYAFVRDGWVWRIRNMNRPIDGVIPTIDFFIMDPVPKSSFVHRIQVSLLRLLQGLLKEHYYWDRYSLVYKICLRITHWAGKLISGNVKFKMYNAISQWGYRNPSNKCSQFNDQFKIIGVQYDAGVLEESVLHAFEDTEFYITKRYDHYLTTQYGDYMTPPPEADRKPMHGME